MVPAVLAAAAIHMLHQHLRHYITGGQGLFDGLWEDEAIATFWQTQTRAIEVKSPANATLTLSNGTAAAGTEPTAAQVYFAAWLVELLGTLAAGVAMYYWSVGVERAFPARPRGLVVAGKDKTGLLSEDREEEVVKQVSTSRAAPVPLWFPRHMHQVPLLEEESADAGVLQWIAQGRVRRSSLSWCNTLAKWLLTTTLGVALQAGVYQTVDTLATQQRPFAVGSRQIPLVRVNPIGLAPY